MKVTDFLKSRVQTKAASFPAGVYREQLARKQSEGADFKRDPVAEDIILRKWEIAFLYSKYVLQGRWPTFEAQMKDAPITRNLMSQKGAYSYAQDVANGPVDSVERQISLNGELSASYAINIAKKPWDVDNPDHKQALASIATNVQASQTYADGLTELSSTYRRRRA